MNSNVPTEPKTTIDELWLRYINRYAFEHGAISESEYQGIERRITVRSERVSNQNHSRGRTTV